MPFLLPLASVWLILNNEEVGRANSIKGEMPSMTVCRTAMNNLNETRFVHGWGVGGTPTQGYLCLDSSSGAVEAIGGGGKRGSSDLGYPLP